MGNLTIAPEGGAADADPFPQVPPTLTADAVRLHERFAPARRRYLQTMMAPSPDEPDRALAHLLGGMSKAALFSVVLSHHFAYDPEQRTTWPTIGAVRRSFLSLGLASARGVDHILARLQALDLVTLDTCPHDGRQRLVLATPRMLDLDMKWLIAQLSAAAELDPDAGIGAELAQGDRRYQRALRHAAGKSRHIARRAIASAGPLQPILMHQDGAQILAHYLLAAGPDLSVALPFNAVAENISTTRTHIRNLIDELAGLGLLEQREKGGHRLVLSADLVSLMDGFIATNIANYHRGWAIARWLVAEGET